MKNKSNATLPRKACKNQWANAAQRALEDAIHRRERFSHSHTGEPGKQVSILRSQV